jgi:hypothetical protein
VEQELENLNKGTTAIDGIYYQLIKNRYNSVIEILNDLKRFEESEGITFSSQIKYEYLHILNIAEELISSLNNEI